MGGDTASAVDYDRHLSAAIPWVVAFVVVMTMLMMGFVFRSFVLALVTAVVNLLSAGAAFGILAAVFQPTWAEGLLNFHSTGGVITWIPLFTFAVLFGLSMDYHVFVLSRIREAAASGLSTRDAVRQGILRSAGTVTSAAIVMVSVFSIFASLHLVEMKELGVSLAAAVLIDAVLVRAVVLPSLLVLLGKDRWAPKSGTPVAVQPERELVRTGASDSAPSQLRWRNPVSMLFSPAPWASAAYLLTYLIVGLAWFVVTLVLVVVSGILSVLWIGLPLLFISLAIVRACAAVERARARIVGVRIEPQYRRATRPGLLGALRAQVTDPARRHDVVSLVLLWPVLFGLDLLAFLAWLIPLALISTPFWYRYVPETYANGTSGHGIALGYFPDGPHGATQLGWFIGDTQSALVAAAVGLALLMLVGNYAVVGAARTHVRLTAPRGSSPDRVVTAARPAYEHVRRSAALVAR